MRMQGAGKLSSLTFQSLTQKLDSFGPSIDIHHSPESARDRDTGQQQGALRPLVGAAEHRATSVHPEANDSPFSFVFLW